MKQSDATRIVQLLTQLAESINGPASRKPPAGTKPPLSERIDRLDNRVSEVQLGLATLAANTKAEFDKVGRRFDGVERRLDKVEGRLDKVDGRLDKVDGRLDKVDGRFDAVDLQFKKTNQHIDDSASMIKDLVERVHSELTGRVIDLEVPDPGGKGSGGKGSGGGVPLAS